jgi:hypothetical protein
MTMAGADRLRPAGDPALTTSSLESRHEAFPRHSAQAAEAEAGHINPRGCPFLLAEGGGWRLGMASREHRCAAFSPATALSPEKQTRLCLTAGHTGCATYVASLNARTERLGAVPVRRATRWGLARTTSVIDDPGGVRGRLLAALLDRRRWPFIPAVILVTTLFVLGLSGFRAGVPTVPVATGSPRVAAATSVATFGGAAALPTPSPAGEETAPPPTTSPSSAPASVGPVASFRTYRVTSGDTLSAIANRFDTTVTAIVNLNDLRDQDSLSIGQVLRIP